jgi:valyl-tRNA synthetase
MSILQAMVTAAREIRADLKLDPKLTLDAALVVRTPARSVASTQQGAIEKLGGVKLTITDCAAEIAGVKRSTPEFDLIVRVSAEQAAVQRTRIAREIERLEKLIANSERQLNDETFISRAPAHVIESIRQKLVEYKAQLNKHRESLE